MMGERRREQLADLAHERWAGWISHVLRKGEWVEGGSVVIPSWVVERYQRLAATPYAELTEDEKDSDRREADRMLAVMGEVWDG